MVNNESVDAMSPIAVSSILESPTHAYTAVSAVGDGGIEVSKVTIVISIGALKSESASRTTIEYVPAVRFGATSNAPLSTWKTNGAVKRLL